MIASNKYDNYCGDEESSSFFHGMDNSMTGAFTERLFEEDAFGVLKDYQSEDEDEEGKQAGLANIKSLHSSGFFRFCDAVNEEEQEQKQREKDRHEELGYEDANRIKLSLDRMTSCAARTFPDDSSYDCSSDDNQHANSVRRGRRPRESLLQTPENNTISWSRNSDNNKKDAAASENISNSQHVSRRRASRRGSSAWEEIRFIVKAPFRSRDSVAFHGLDANDDGYLTKDEISQWVRTNPIVWGMLSVNLNLDENTCVDIVTRVILSMYNTDKSTKAPKPASKRPMTIMEAAELLMAENEESEGEQEGSPTPTNMTEEASTTLATKEERERLGYEDDPNDKEDEDEDYITKEEFKEFKKQYVDDPHGSQEFFHRLVFAAFDDDGNGHLDPEEFDKFLDVFYESGSIFKGDSRLPCKEKLKEIAYTQLDVNGDGVFEFEEIRSLISGSALKTIHKISDDVDKNVEKIDIATIRHDSNELNDENDDYVDNDIFMDHDSFAIHDSFNALDHFVETGAKDNDDKNDVDKRENDIDNLISASSTPPEKTTTTTSTLSNIQESTVACENNTASSAEKTVSKPEKINGNVNEEPSFSCDAPADNSSERPGLVDYGFKSIFGFGYTTTNSTVSSTKTTTESNDTKNDTKSENKVDNNANNDSFSSESDDSGGHLYHRYYNLRLNKFDSLVSANRPSKIDSCDASSGMGLMLSPYGEAYDNQANKRFSNQELSTNKNAGKNQNKKFARKSIAIMETATATETTASVATDSNDDDISVTTTSTTTTTTTATRSSFWNFFGLAESVRNFEVAKCDNWKSFQSKYDEKKSDPTLQIDRRQRQSSKINTIEAQALGLQASALGNQSEFIHSVNKANPTRTSIRAFNKGATKKQLKADKKKQKKSKKKKSDTSVGTSCTADTSISCNDSVFAPPIL